MCTEISAEVLIIDTTTSIGCNGIQFLSRVYLICYTKQIYSTLHHVVVSRKQKTYFDPTAITDTLHGIHLKSMQFIHRGDLTISLSLFDCIMILLFSMHIHVLKTFITICFISGKPMISTLFTHQLFNILYN